VGIGGGEGKQLDFWVVVVCSEPEHRTGVDDVEMLVPSQTTYNFLRVSRTWHVLKHNICVVKVTEVYGPAILPDEGC
jgi:hypothetical protein